MIVRPTKLKKKKRKERKEEEEETDRAKSRVTDPHRFSPEISFQDNTFMRTVFFY